MNRSIFSDPVLNGIWIDYTPDSSMSSLLAKAESDLLLVVTDPEILLSSKAVKSMVQHAENRLSALGPTYNLTPYLQQQADLPSPYLNIATFNEIVYEIFNNFRHECQPVNILDPSVILYSVSFLQQFTRHQLQHSPMPFSKLEFAKKVIKGSLVHRFGDYYDGERPDLVEMIPGTVKKILDVGCAMGGYGRGLKKTRPDISLTGVEMNSFMARKARKYYDYVFEGKIEDMAIDHEFDLVNCGDVLEHLYDPWNMLLELRKVLHKGGYLVMSIPNAGHWTIVRDLLNRQFEYVPVGLLCVTHIRWFTAVSIKKALKDSGFRVEIFNRQQLPPTKAGLEFIKAMTDTGYGNKKSLLTNEFIIRAVKE